MSHGARHGVTKGTAFSDPLGLYFMKFVKIINNLLAKNRNVFRNNAPDHDIIYLISRWDRYLGMTAAMTQVPVPTAIWKGVK